MQKHLFKNPKNTDNGRNYRKSKKSFNNPFLPLETGELADKQEFIDIKIGSKLVQGNCVFEVFNITFIDINQKTARLIHYRPLFKNDNNSTLTGSVPEKNLGLSDFRKPSTKKEIKLLYEYLSVRLKKKSSLDIDEAENLLKRNNLRSTFYVIKKLARENKNSTTFTKMKRDLLNKAIDMVTEEISLVTEKSPEMTKRSILKSLNIL